MEDCLNDLTSRIIPVTDKTKQASPCRSYLSVDVRETRSQRQRLFIRAVAASAIHPQSFQLTPPY